MMSNCNECSSNSWWYKYEEGIIHAKCENCGYEILFESKKKEKITKNSLCRKCKTPVVYEKCKIRPKQLKRSYYFTGRYRCPACKEIYYSEEFKVINDKSSGRQAEVRLF